AMGTSARNVVLLGDPLQLAQVSQGVHPAGSGGSVLDHLLGEAATITEDRGIFLAETRRMHPDVCGFEPNLFIGATGKGSITFPVSTPGDMVRLRFGAHYRARDARDGLDYQVSFDRGKRWKTVDRAAGPTPGDCKYVVFSDIPRGTRAVLVRFAGTSRNATGIFNFRIDADYREPHGRFRPVKVVYHWEEDGKQKQHLYVARQSWETYTIHCGKKPLMKSIVLELAE
ncbi:MAG: hypothetical protein HYS12_05360, partial [Planctomycetes bacterium]|nr:hypothetical protein [Planctomycetota bacterium]